jgi:hypothetical protein
MWRGAAAPLLFLWLFKKLLCIFLMPTDIRVTLTGCPLQAPPLRHTVWGAADGILFFFWVFAA